MEAYRKLTNLEFFRNWVAYIGIKRLIMKFKLQGNTEVGGMLGIVMIKKFFFSDNPLQKTLKNLRNLKI